MSFSFLGVFLAGLLTFLSPCVLPLVPILLFALAADRLAPVLNGLKKYLPRIEYAAGLGLFLFGIYIAQQARFQPAQVPGAPVGIAVTLNSGDRVQLSSSESEKSEKRPARMLFFYSEHCPICRAMEPLLPAVEKSCAGLDFQLLRVDVDLPENQVAASRFAVRATPTIALINSEGIELVHLVGFQTEGRLIEAATMAAHVACGSPAPFRPGENSDDPFAAPPINPGQSCAEGKFC